MVAIFTRLTHDSRVHMYMYSRGRATPTKNRGGTKMVDLLDQFESAGLRGPSEQAARRRPQQNINPFDEPDVGSLPAVSHLTLLWSLWPLFIAALLHDCLWRALGVAATVK